MKGEVSIPDNVIFFSGSYSMEMRGHLEHKDRDSLILVQLMQYTAVLGQNSFLVNITHALTLKSITGSKRVVTLEQCSGHCASNETVSRVEKGLEEHIMFQEDVNYVKDGVLKQPGLAVEMALDNFDIDIETLNGSGTIHHTYRMIY